MLEELPLQPAKLKNAKLKKKKRNLVSRGKKLVTWKMFFLTVCKKDVS